MRASTRQSVRASRALAKRGGAAGGHAHATLGIAADGEIDAAVFVLEHAVDEGDI
jgi:hypothetical protein